MARGLWCSRRQTESTCKDPSPGAAYLYTPPKDTCVGGGGGHRAASLRGEEATGCNGGQVGGCRRGPSKN